MADISAVYMSIDVYSSSLDKLVAKTDQVENKLLNFSSIVGGAFSNMFSESSVLGMAVSKINMLSVSTEDAAGNMTKVSIATETMINMMVKAGGSADDMTDKMLNASKNSEEAADNLLKAGESADELNKSLNGSEKSSDKASKGIKKLLSSIVNMDKLKKSVKGLVDIDGAKKSIKGLVDIDNLKKATELIDKYSLTNSKLSNINDGSQTDKILQDKIYASAGRSRGSYMEMAGNVSTLQSTTGNLFGSNDETIAFTELSQKAMVGDGLSVADRTSTMSKLTDSMAGGSLSKDNLGSLEKSAPSIYNALSSYIGKSGESLETLASQGGITAEVLKNAMFAASDSINTNFQDAPMTFADIWTQIKDSGLQAFSDVMEKITELLNNKDFQTFLNGLTNGFSLLGDGVMWLINTIIAGWNIIGPILGIFAFVYITSLIIGLVSAALSWLLMVAPILLIVGLISLVFFALTQLGVTWQDIIGVISGVLGVFAAFFYNRFVYFWNVVAEFINFFGNVFRDPINSIKILFFDLASNALGFIETMAKGIEDLLNKIPGVNVDITSNITALKTDLEAEASKLKDESDYKEYVKTKKYQDLEDAYNGGSKLGLDLYTKASDGISNIFDPDNGIPDNTGDFPYDKYTGTEPIIPETDPSNPVPVEGTGSNGTVNVSMEDEDLDYLRDIAERDYIANVATNSLAPNISIQFGDVHENADANKIAGRIKRILQEEIAMASEGGY